MNNTLAFIFRVPFLKGLRRLHVAKVQLFSDCADMSMNAVGGAPTTTANIYQEKRFVKSPLKNRVVLQ